MEGPTTLREAGSGAWQIIEAPATRTDAKGHGLRLKNECSAFIQMMVLSKLAGGRRELATLQENFGFSLAVARLAKSYARSRARYHVEFRSGR